MKQTLNVRPSLSQKSLETTTKLVQPLRRLVCTNSQTDRQTNKRLKRFYYMYRSCERSIQKVMFQAFGEHLCELLYADQVEENLR